MFCHTREFFFLSEAFVKLGFPVINRLRNELYRNMDCSSESQSLVAAATASVLHPSAASNRACYIPSPNCSNKNGVNQSGTCFVFRRDRISIVNWTGLLRQHGPRGNECKGSRSRPYPGSQKSFTARRAKCSVGQIFSSSVTAGNQ
jgi:hypothetical protein